MNILITGGSGYIGSHTILALIEKGYENIYSIDNYVNSDPSNYKKIEKISGKSIKYKQVDLNNLLELDSFFSENEIFSVIHFAALKSVPESVDLPLSYYQNNLNGMLNLLTCMQKYKVNQLVFSSSCSVYGNPEKLPVNELTPFGIAESPYARTKQIGENLLFDYCKANPKFKAISLRYFNPVGAHKSGLIGEGFSKKPNNLVPVITQSAAGLRGKITIFGDDYDTRDGSCVRDYIHVEDIAEAHVLAIDYFEKLPTNYDVINLGTGTGTTVLEILKSFEKISNLKLDYLIGERRVGDVESIYADNSKAKDVLNWNPKNTVDIMMASAWKWQQNIKV